MTRNSRPHRSNNGGMSKWTLLVLMAAILLAGWGGMRYWRKGPGATSLSGTKFTVVKGPLEINVLEGGSIESREKQEIKCEVQGETKILKIIEEGTQITQENVDNKLVLIELDSKKLVDVQVAQELEYQNALAAFTDAREAYDIQLNQNESDLKAAELAAKFARMDMEKYLGEVLAGEIAAKIDTQHAEDMAKDDTRKAKLPAPSENAPPENKDASATTATPAVPEETEGEEDGGGAEPKPETPLPELPSSLPAIDMLAMANPDKLGDGEAMQKIRQLDSDQMLSAQDLGLAKTKLDGTKRLFEKEFVTKTQMDNDEYAYKRKEVSVQTMETSKNLFLKYEFPKSAQKLVSGYDESLRAMERTRKLAVSKLAQAEARRVSAEARFVLQEKKRAEIAEQIEKCVIRATRPGLVVYGNGEHSWRSEVIEEGAAVRERQVLITIPDTSAMDTKVQIHESFVQKIAVEQSARIRVDAFPSQSLTGKVHRISVLPDAQNRWMNPDLKVYTTIIQIDGQHEWLKPGMSAEAEIIIDTLQDAVQVPLQAVSLDKKEQVCYVSGPLGVERRVVETGAFGTAMIEIKKGLTPGETVLLIAPESPQEERGGEGKGKDEAGAGKDDGEKKAPKKEKAQEKPKGEPSA